MIPPPLFEINHFNIIATELILVRVPFPVENFICSAMQIYNSMIYKLVLFQQLSQKIFRAISVYVKSVCTIHSKTSVSLLNICSLKQSYVTAVWNIGILWKLCIQGKFKFSWLFIVSFLSSTNFIPPTVKIENLNNYPNSHSLTVTLKKSYIKLIKQALCMKLSTKFLDFLLERLL